MPKILIFNGSPRKNGYTSKLLKQIADGAKSEGAEIIEFDLNDPGIRGCQGCYYCRTHEGCSVKDYLQPMYEAIKEADAIVLGSPNYYGQITGQTKVWLDRTFPMIARDFSPRYPGKKIITVFSQGDTNPSNGADAIKYIHDVMAGYGWELQDSIHFCGASGNPYPAVFEEFSDRAFKAGANLAR